MKNLVLIIFFGFCHNLIAQTTHTVDNNPSAGADFTSLQAAIDAAVIGDTIYVHPSAVAYGNITINKTLHLRGPGHLPEVTSGEAATIGNITFTAVIGAPNSSISGLRTGDISTGNSQNYSGLTLTNNRLGRVLGSNTLNQSNGWVISGNVFLVNMFSILQKGNNSNWVVVNNFIQNQATSSTWQIFTGFNASDLLRNNIIVSSQNTGNVKIFENCLNTVFENNLLLFLGTATGLNNTGSSVTFNNNLTYSYTGLTLSDLPGATNLNNTDPQFVNGGTTPTFGYSKDFNLTDSSPGSGYGVDGQDIGIYGNSYPFDMRGYPDDLPYVTSLIINNTVVSTGGTLNVQFAAEGN